jgi:chitodextrinase
VEQQQSLVPLKPFSRRKFLTTATASFSVMALSACGGGDGSAADDTMSALGKGGTKGRTDTAAPSVPTGVTATVVSATSIAVSWGASTDNVGVARYRLYRCSGNGCAPATLVANVTALTYTDGALPEGTYSYNVEAMDAAGNVSARSAVATATISPVAAPAPSPSPSPTPGSAIYEAESGTWGGGASIQYASNASGGQAIGTMMNAGAYTQVTVDGGAGGAASLVVRFANGHSVNRSLSLYVNGVRQRQVVFVPTGGWNTFVDSEAVAITLTAGSNAVRLQTDSGDSPDADIDRFVVTIGGTTSAPSDGTAPSVPSGVTATATSSSSITVNWSASTDNVGVVGYRVYRCSGNGCTSVAQVASLTGTTYTDSGLLAGTSYSYSVAAVDAAGNVSARSALATATTATVSTAPAAWNIDPAPVLVAGSASTYDLAPTLPQGVVRGGVFSIDPSGAPLPSGVTLTSAGVLSATATASGSFSGVVFSYREPG